MIGAFIGAILIGVLEDGLTLTGVSTNDFYVWVGVVGADGADVVGWYPAANFDVVGPLLDPAPVAVARMAPVHVNATWEVEA